MGLITTLLKIHLNFQFVSYCFAEAMERRLTGVTGLEVFLSVWKHMPLQPLWPLSANAESLLILKVITTNIYMNEMA